MKKILLVLIIALLLTGCASHDYKTELKQGLIDAALIEYERINNHTKKYYSFYIDKSVSNIISENDYSVLKFLGNTFSMNLNVREIVSDGYYEPSVFNYDRKYLTFNEKGTYIDDLGNEEPYHVLVYEDDGLCYLIFKGKDVYCYSLLDKTQVYDVAIKMMSILKSVSINNDEVIASYSAKETITHSREATELFTSNVPTTTTLEEIINRNGVLDYEETENDESENSETLTEETQITE